MLNRQLSVYPSQRDIEYISIKRDKKNPIHPQKPEITVQGKGTEIKTGEGLKPRAKRKTITQSIMLALIDVAEKKLAQNRVKAYWNTYYCQTRIIQTDNRLHGKYCKNRFCKVCNSIKKAELINKYLPVIKTWPDPHFVTLTAKAVPAKSLERRISDLIRGLRIIISKYKKKAQRGTGKKLIGIKAIECNFNPVRHTYNPHLHLVVYDKETAEILVNEWLKLCTEKFALRCAQDIRQVKDREQILIEVIKYNTKYFTDPTMQKGKKAKISPFVYASALDNIISAMQKHRVFDRFGFNLPSKEKQRGGTPTKITEYKELLFDRKLCDWIDKETDSPLTGYQPSPELTAILENNIDRELQ